MERVIKIGTSSKKIKLVYEKRVNGVVRRRDKKIDRYRERDKEKKREI